MLLFLLLIAFFEREDYRDNQIICWSHFIWPWKEREREMRTY